MSLPTALGVGLLGVAALASTAHGGFLRYAMAQDATGIQLRRLLPAALFSSPLLAFSLSHLEVPAPSAWRSKPRPMPP
ncbi:MAG: hypothetical protein R3F59_33600 [Myxococcota bacterium]